MTGLAEGLLARLGGLALAFLMGVAAGQQLAQQRSTVTGLRQQVANAQGAASAAQVGTTTVAQLGADLAEIRATTATVQQGVRHAPLVTARLSAAAPAAAPVPALAPPLSGRGLVPPGGQPGRTPRLGGEPVGADVAADAAAVDATGLAPGAAPGDAPAVRLQLSLAAVSLWNSALAGRLVPAGACRADDPTAAPCADGAGLTVEDAWANHAINAGACAEDRARYQRLIDYLTRTRAAR